MISIFCRILAAVLMTGSMAGYLAGQDKSKLKSEDVLAKHIESIGAPDAVAAARNRKIEGSAQVRNVRNRTSTVIGGAFLASTPDKNVVLMAFEAPNVGDYRGERVYFDGKKLVIPYVTAAERSPAGTFIFDYPEIAKGYLLGGVLSASWALLDAPAKVGKFELQGREKIGETEAYKVRYVPKGGSSLTIRMYFDVATFRHIRTEYQRTETAGTVRVDEGRLNENRFKLVEDFSDFSLVDGLNLPKAYKVTFRYETLRSSSEIEWSIKLTRFDFDSSRTPEIFGQVTVP